MAYANNITRLCEVAAAQYLRGIDGLLVGPEAIFAGFDDGNLITPRVECNCDRAEPNGHPDDAVWDCSLEVQVITSCDNNTADAHHEMAGQIFSQFMIGRQQTADAISAAREDFHCQDILPTAQAKELKDRKWTSSILFKMTCSGIDMDI